MQCSAVQCNVVQCFEGGGTLVRMISFYGMESGEQGTGKGRKHHFDLLRWKMKKVLLVLTDPVLRGLFYKHLCHSLQIK